MILKISTGDGYVFFDNLCELGVRPARDRQVKVSFFTQKPPVNEQTKEQQTKEQQAGTFRIPEFAHFGGMNGEQEQWIVFKPQHVYLWAGNVSNKKERFIHDVKARHAITGEWINIVLDAGWILNDQGRTVESLHLTEL